MSALHFDVAGAAGPKRYFEALTPERLAHAYLFAGPQGVGKKTFARRLAEEGTSFQDLLDGVRMERAREYLNGGRHSLEEIATLLGFATASAFSRAYKRLAGSAPGRDTDRPRG